MGVVGGLMGLVVATLWSVLLGLSKMAALALAHSPSSSAVPFTLANPRATAITKPLLVAEECKLSQFTCSSGTCIPLDHFCDGNDDCGDRSDEPRYCTPCNRTYYGEVGTTYEVEIRRPREDRLPFICHITFTAGGGIYGDIVQLTFDTFTVGKFVSFTVDGCPDGFMRLSETGLPAPGGRWCGSAWGYTVYYSETRSVTVSLELYRLSEQGIGYNFDLRVSYKSLPRSEALLRYGSLTDPIYRGELVEGTYCDRLLEGCLSRKCRVQSPNYPGIYPRNVTCRYRITQSEVPSGQHAMITVRQPNGQKIHIKDQIVKYDRRQRVLKVWDECNIVQDYLTVYDGSTVDGPRLVRLCSGDMVPDIVASGPEMLVEFRTSPYDNPFHPVPLSYLPGFELEVSVTMVNVTSHSFVWNHECEFLVTSFENNMGELENPRHSLPPNSTCRYFFQGKSHERVWISFTKYHVGSAIDPMYREEECQTRLRLWDGRTAHTGSREVNVSLLGEFCREELPRLCDHALLANSTRQTRPCAAAESYVSSGSELTLEQKVKEATALHPVTFHLRYEFVDNSLDGEAMAAGGLCDRLFRSSNPGPHSGRFRSPRNVFMFGRGGMQNLSCTYRFQGQPNERVKLHLTKLKLGDRGCETRYDHAMKRHTCFSRTNVTGELWLSEYPWPDVQVSRQCFCSGDRAPVIFVSPASVVELNLTITFMNITHDYRDFFFEGSYEFLKTPECGRNLRVRGSSGEIVLRSPSEMSEDVQCQNHPWLIEPEEPENFLYLQVQGYELGPNVLCPSLNRIAIYAEKSTRKSRLVCPVPRELNSYVDVFSGGWNASLATSSSSSSRVFRRGGGSGTEEEEDLARNVLVEFRAHEPGVYVVKWIEVSRRPFQPVSSLVSRERHECVHRCPELNACISGELWCDGAPHCPSGFDEAEDNCTSFTIPLLYICIGAGSMAVLILLVLSTLVHKCRKRHKKKKKKKKGAKRVPTEEIIIDGKDSIC